MPRTAKVQFEKLHDTRADADAVVAELNLNLKPTDDGKQPTQYRSYRIAIPDGIQPGEKFVVSKNPSSACLDGAKALGVEVEGGGNSVPPPAAYLEMLTDEQRAEMLKLLKNAAKAK